MKNILLVACCFVAVIFAVESCGGSEKTPANDTAKSNVEVAASASAAGKTLYDAKCTMCHGADGAAGVMGAADLSKSTLTHDATIMMVKNGKNSMKAFASELNEAEVESVVKYVESLRK